MKPCKCGETDPKKFYHRRSEVFDRDGYRKQNIMRPCIACQKKVRLIRKEMKEVPEIILAKPYQSLADILRLK